MMLVGGGIGFWLGIAGPIKREWKVIEPIVARGGKVETVDSEISRRLVFKPKVQIEFGSDTPLRNHVGRKTIGSAV